jgi:ADP-ribose pyrophosphatase
MKDKLIQTARTLADVDIISREQIGRGWGKLERLKLRHRRFDNEWSEEMERDVYTIGESINLIPYDPKLDAVLLIEQFRPCGLIWGEATWLIEGIAGMIGAGESPADVAKREAVEEADCVIEEPHPISLVYTSPGGYGERAHLFAARADLSKAGGVHGLAEEHEDIRVLVAPLSEAMNACDDGRIRDAKTILMLQWLARNRQVFN